MLWVGRTMMRGVRTGFGRCRLTIAGANAPSAVRALARHPDIRVLGLVDDLTEVYRRASLLIAPMQAGGGPRHKALDAAAFGGATVANPPAAGGLFSPRQPRGGGWQPPSEFVAPAAPAPPGPA